MGPDPLIAWLLALAALAAHPPYLDEAADLQVVFPEGWTWAPGGTLVEGQRLQATHGPTGGGALLRLDPFDPSAELPERVRQRVGDVEAALSADRYARAVALSQDDGSADRTLYLGLSDVAGARVGRWVFSAEATGDEPARIWWQATWRVEGGMARLVAWVPEARLDAFLPAMRALEQGLGTVSGQPPRATLLARADGPRCEGPASLDRMAAVAASAPFGHARQSLAAEGWTPSSRARAELQALGLLLEAVDGCVNEAARRSGACLVWERSSTTPRSQALQREVVRCVEEHRPTRRGLEAVLSPR